MKTILEFGYPQSALENHPCGVSGSVTFKTIKEGIHTAKQIIFVLSKGKTCTANIPFDVAKNKPRVIYWHNDRSFWVSLSVLDDVARGAYSAVADKGYIEDNTQGDNA